MAAATDVTIHFCCDNLVDKDANGVHSSEFYS